mmetsp:Transcript_110706/g.220088  ORF Transcript_110706/g.220088 Transcript_110706/m.220088 type:complete len:262 (-) Transcript_110706:356-1141(-)
MATRTWSSHLRGMLWIEAWHPGMDQCQRCGITMWILTSAQLQAEKELMDSHCATDSPVSGFRMDAQSTVTSAMARLRALVPHAATRRLQRLRFVILIFARLTVRQYVGATRTSTISLHGVRPAVHLSLIRVAWREVHPGHKAHLGGPQEVPPVLVYATRTQRMQNRATSEAKCCRQHYLVPFGLPGIWWKCPGPCEPIMGVATSGELRLLPAISQSRFFRGPSWSQRACPVYGGVARVVSSCGSTPLVFRRAPYPQAPLGL